MGDGLIAPAGNTALLGVAVIASADRRAVLAATLVKLMSAAVARLVFAGSKTRAMSKLYFTCSAMNAGKSAILLQAAHDYRKRGMEASLWTSSNPADAPRAQTGVIESRIGLAAPARIFRPDTDLLAAVSEQKSASALDAVFIDEAPVPHRSPGRSARPGLRRSEHAGPVLRAAHRLPGQAVRRRRGVAGAGR